MYEKIKRDIQNDYYQQNFPNDGQKFIAGIFVTYTSKMKMKQRWISLMARR